jgi:hypothetical protein
LFSGLPLRIVSPAFRRPGLHSIPPHQYMAFSVRLQIVSRETFNNTLFIYYFPVPKPGALTNVSRETSIAAGLIPAVQGFA